jgi:hypothetical protein
MTIPLYFLFIFLPWIMLTWSCVSESLHFSKISYVRISPFVPCWFFALPIRIFFFTLFYLFLSIFFFIYKCFLSPFCCRQIADCVGLSSPSCYIPFVLLYPVFRFGSFDLAVSLEFHHEFFLMPFKMLSVHFIASRLFSLLFSIFSHFLVIEFVILFISFQIERK